MADTDGRLTLNGLALNIRILVDYCWSDELHDYEVNEESRPEHIFNKLVALDNYIEGTSFTPESYLRTGAPNE